MRRWSKIVLVVVLTSVVVMLAGVIYSLPSTPFNRRPTITTSRDADVPLITSERFLPAPNFNMHLTWTGDSALLISSSSVIRGFRVQTMTGEVVEEHSLPYGNIYHEILSTHEIITQTDLGRGVPFEAVDLRGGRMLLQGTDPPPHSPYGAAGNVSFATNKDRSVVAVGYGPPHSDQPVTFYNTSTWQKLATLTLPLPHPANFWSMKLSDDGKYLAYNADDAVTIVDVANGTVVQRLPVSSAWFAFSPDGQMIAIAGCRHGECIGTKPQVAVHVFRLSDGTDAARRTEESKSFAKSIVWDPHGRFLAYLDGQTVHVWNPSAGPTSDTVIRVRSDGVIGLAISPNGQFIAIGDGYAIDLFRVGS